MPPLSKLALYFSLQGNPQIVSSVPHSHVHTNFIPFELAVLPGPGGWFQISFLFKFVGVKMQKNCYRCETFMPVNDGFMDKILGSVLI